MPSLGYGCTQLTTFKHRREAVRLLEHAFAEGITHYDVARGYGFGRAEGILGEFLKGKRQRLTLATKFGLQPPVGLAGNRFVIDGIKRILRPFPGLLRRAKSQGSAMVKSGMFDPAIAVASLEKSLRELGTDYIDFFLLHEAQLSDAANEGLIEILQAQVAGGKIRSFGIASAFEKLQRDASLLPPPYRIIQFDDDAVTRNVSKLAHTEGRTLITHSIFKPLALLRAAVRERPDVVQKFSSRMQLDVADERVLGSLLLHHALGGCARFVLFSTTNPARVTENLRDAASSPYDEKQLAIFTSLVEELLGQRSANRHPGTPSSADLQPPNLENAS